MSEVIPNQDTYLSPFCEDTPTSLGEWLKIYNLFTKIGDDGTMGYNSTRITSPFNTLPNVSARVYDPDGIDFSGSRTGDVFSLNGGIVVVNNIVIELEAFETNFNELDSHWSTGGTYGGWNFTSDAVSSAAMCVLFEPYDGDGEVDVNETPAKIVYVQYGSIDYDIMAPLWIVRVSKSGSVVTGAELLLEASGVSFKVQQIGFWKNFIVDGGDLD